MPLFSRVQSNRLSRRRLLVTASAALLLGGCTSAAHVRRMAQMRYPATGEMVDTPGGRVHLQRFGAANPGPTAVLIHGASGNLRDFTLSFAQALAAEGVPVIAVDRPGFGYSDRGDGLMAHPSAQAWRLDAAMASLGIEQIIPVGHSYGAAVAIAWGLAHPQRAVAVVTISGFTWPMKKADNPYHALVANPATARAVTALMRDFLSRANPVDVVDFVFDPQPVPAGYAEHVGGALAFRQETMIANGQDIDSANRYLTRLSAKYPLIAVPVLAIHGQADWLVEVDNSARLVAAVPDGELIALPGIGHMPHHVAELEVVAAIAALHQRLRAA